MQRAIEAWTRLRGSGVPINDNITAALKKFGKSYVIHGCMVLLHSEAIEILYQFHDDLSDLYILIVDRLKVTHIATTRPIPLYQQDGTSENEVRSPTNFLPLYGDFGPEPTEASILRPTKADFDKAFWVSAKQNGIHQVWAPRYTMFSRGNISEKARLLTLPSVVSAVGDGERDGRSCATVDMYAGVGYFTFSYLRAGVRKVLAWDLNPWSIEGLQRGAKANKWGVVVINKDEEVKVALEKEDVRVVAFCESNERAAERIGRARGVISPIRHVNCGLLPTSRRSWATAVKVLVPDSMGWLHVHENFAVTEVDVRAEEVRAEVERLINELDRGMSGDCRRKRTVTVEHINHLKSYAPGVMHCVVDIAIDARYWPPVHCFSFTDHSDLLSLGRLSWIRVHRLSQLKT